MRTERQDETRLPARGETWRDNEASTFDQNCLIIGIARDHNGKMMVAYHRDELYSTAVPMIRCDPIEWFLEWSAIGKPRFTFERKADPDMSAGPFNNNERNDWVKQPGMPQPIPSALPALPLERDAFKANFSDLYDLTEVDDYGGKRFKHAHVESIWHGWLHRSMQGSPPAGFPAKMQPVPSKGFTVSAPEPLHDDAGTFAPTNGIDNIVDYVANHLAIRSLEKPRKATITDWRDVAKSVINAVDSWRKR